MAARALLPHSKKPLRSFTTESAKHTGTMKGVSKIQLTGKQEDSWNIVRREKMHLIGKRIEVP